MKYLTTLCVLGIVGSALADWPQFRGPDGQGVSTDKGTPLKWSADDNVAWKTILPGAGTSSPAVFGEHIYLTCYSGYGLPRMAPGDMESLKRHLLCLKRDGGEILWNKEVPSKLPEQPSNQIREGHGYASSTPAVDAERIYTFFGKSGAFAHDHTGKQLWQADVGSTLHGWGSAASPVVWKDLVFINASVESDSLVALNKKDGTEVWRARGIRESWNTPILVTPPGGKTELVVAIMGDVIGFDPESGDKLWSCKTDIGWYMVPGLVAHEGIVYCIGGRSGGALAVRTGGKGDVTKTHRLWKGIKGSNVSSPIYHDGHLYFANDATGILLCVDAKTGKSVYEERIDRTAGVYSSPVLADGKIYYFMRDGAGLVVPARPEFELLARNPLPRGEEIDSCPAIDRGQILVRTNRHLYCFGKK